jgi:hypothetical protein
MRNNPMITLVYPYTNNGFYNWTNDWYKKEVVMDMRYIIPTIYKCSKNMRSRSRAYRKEQYILQINVYNKHTGLIAAPALIENAEVIPTTLNTNANGLTTSDIIRLTFYIQSQIN